MRIWVQLCLLGLVLLLCSAVLNVGYAQHVHSAAGPASTEPGLGDKGYKHDELHDHYQKFFDGKCHCTVGECRPTLVRVNPAVPDTAMEVLIDKKWYPVLKGTVKLRDNIPAELLEYQAHVCARHYVDAGWPKVIIECVVYNGAT